MTALFDAAALTEWVGETVTTARAAAVEKVVWGWLKPVLGLQARPDDISDELHSWSIELGGIAHENPTGLSAYQLGNERSQYSWERRTEILTEAGNAGRPAGTAGLPRGRFPAACDWPDPARPR